MLNPVTQNPTIDVKYTFPGLEIGAYHIGLDHLLLFLLFVCFIFGFRHLNRKINLKNTEIQIDNKSSSENLNNPVFNVNPIINIDDTKNNEALKILKKEIEDTIKNLEIHRETLKIEQMSSEINKEDVSEKIIKVKKEIDAISDLLEKIYNYLSEGDHELRSKVGILLDCNNFESALIQDSIWEILKYIEDISSPVDFTKCLSTFNKMIKFGSFSSLMAHKLDVFHVENKDNGFSYTKNTMPKFKYDLKKEYEEYYRVSDNNCASCGGHNVYRGTPRKWVCEDCNKPFYSPS